MKKEKQKKKLGLVPKILIIVVIIATVAAISGVISNMPESDTGSGSASASQEAGANSAKETVVYSDSDLKISYIKLSDGADLGVTACYVHLKVENLSDKTVIVSLCDGYANDTAVNLASGVPMKLAPGKNSSTPFLFGYDGIFSSIDEVEKLEFKVRLFSEDYSETIKTTENITIQTK